MYKNKHIPKNKQTNKTLEDAVKTVLRGKCIAINTYIFKKETQITNLVFYLN